MATMVEPMKPCALVYWLDRPDEFTSLDAELSATKSGQKV